MNNDHRMIRAFMQRLVELAGGVDAAAALIGAATGAEVSKGSVSKRLAGHLEWPLVEIIALERAVGVFPVTEWIIRERPQHQEKTNLMTAVTEAYRENGEALATAMAVGMGKGSAQVAQREVRESIAVLRKIEAALETMGAIA